MCKCVRDVFHPTLWNWCAFFKKKTTFVRKRAWTYADECTNVSRASRNIEFKTFVSLTTDEIDDAKNWTNLRVYQGNWSCYCPIDFETRAKHLTRTLVLWCKHFNLHANEDRISRLFAPNSSRWRFIPRPPCLPPMGTTVPNLSTFA